MILDGCAKKVYKSKTAKKSKKGGDGENKVVSGTIENTEPVVENAETAKSIGGSKKKNKTIKKKKGGNVVIPNDGKDIVAAHPQS